MFKEMVIPIQAWLLSQGRCTGCGRPLIGAKKEEQKNGIKKAFCECGRFFIYDLKAKRYYNPSVRDLI